jgi:DNA-binding beta-propeller fold protein YncE
MRSRSADRSPTDRRRRPLGGLVVVAVLLAACTTADKDPAARPGAPEEGPDGGALLLATTDNGDAAIDGASGALVAGGPGTVATPDGATMFRATQLDRRTVVTTLDARTGRTVASTPLRGDLELAIASVTGRAIALVEPAPGAPTGSLPGLPVPRAWTPIVVADPSGATPPARFRLEGNYEPEAFSLDDGQLFLIQYLPAEAPAVYRVTVLDLATGDVSPVTGRFKTPPERMPGVRLGQVYDPVTAQMYTLYSNQPGAYAEGYEHAGGTSHDWPEETFVHVLNLRKGWAYCAGVPEEMWGGTAREQSLVPSPDGRWLYIVDAGEGMVAVMDTRTLEIVRSGRIDLGGEASDLRTSLAVSPGGETLFVAAGAEPGTVSAIATADLTTVEAWPSPLPASGLGLSLDGSGLYVAGAGRIALLDLATGEPRATVPTTVVEPIVSLDPLPGVVADALGDAAAGVDLAR